MPGNADKLMTIEELSLRSGVTTRNIRAYQSRGLLPQPESVPGRRTSLYGSGHLARLRLINRLQERGFSLAGIADLLEALHEGKTLEQVLGMEAAVAESEEDDSRVVTQEELEDFIPAGMQTEVLLETLREVGLVIRDGAHYRIRHPALLELGRDAHEAGIPFDALLDEFSRVQSDAQRIAHRFVELYNEHIWRPYMAAGMPQDRLTDMVERMKRMRRLAIEIVEPMMSEAIASEIDSIAQTNLPSPDEVALADKAKDKPQSAKDL